MERGAALHLAFSSSHNGFDPGSSRHENVPLRPSPCSEVALASGAVRCLPESTLDEETVRLLRALRESPTDLAKLVKTIHRRRRRVVAIAPKAIARWNRDDPDSWKRVRAGARVGTDDFSNPWRVIRLELGGRGPDPGGWATTPVPPAGGRLGPICSVTSWQTPQGIVAIRPSSLLLFESAWLPSSRLRRTRN